MSSRNMESSAGLSPAKTHRRPGGGGFVALSLLCILVLAVVGGCGRPGLERTIVSGTVTYQGQPLKQGRIRFFPAKGTRAPISGADITDGKYTVKAKGGVPVGTYNIRIVAHRTDPRFRELEESPGVDAAPAERPPQQQYLPEKYNRRSELEATIEPGERKQTLDFDLKK